MNVVIPANTIRISLRLVLYQEKHICLIIHQGLNSMFVIPVLLTFKADKIKKITEDGVFSKSKILLIVYKEIQRTLVIVYIARKITMSIN